MHQNCPNAYEVFSNLKPIRKRVQKCSELFATPTITTCTVCSIFDQGYRFGFNGKEIDKGAEGMGGGGSTYDYGFRIYNPNLGKFLSVDPLSDEYPWNSTYAFAENDVIRCIDLDGLEKYYSTTGKFLGQRGDNSEIMVATINDADIINLITKVNSGNYTMDESLILNNSAKAVISCTDEVMAKVYLTIYGEGVKGLVTKIGIYQDDAAEGGRCAANSNLIEINKLGEWKGQSIVNNYYDVMCVLLHENGHNDDKNPPPPGEEHVFDHFDIHMKAVESKYYKKSSDNFKSYTKSLLHQYISGQQTAVETMRLELRDGIFTAEERAQKEANYNHYLGKLKENMATFKKLFKTEWKPGVE